MVMNYTIRIPWRLKDTNERWNDICAWTVEQYGLPGTRFEWHANENYMDFVFKTSKDAEFFALRWL